MGAELTVTGSARTAGTGGNWALRGLELAGTGPRVGGNVLCETLCETGETDEWNVDPESDKNVGDDGDVINFLWSNWNGDG